MNFIIAGAILDGGFLYNVIARSAALLIVCAEVATVNKSTRETHLQVFKAIATCLSQPSVLLSNLLLRCIEAAVQNGCSDNEFRNFFQETYDQLINTLDGLYIIIM